MVYRRWLAPVFALAFLVSPILGQPPKSKNPVEERLKAGRLEAPDGIDAAKFNQMRLGGIALDNPTDADRAVLEGMAKQLIYPVTNFEYYSTPEAANAELLPRPDERTVGRLVSDLRSRLVVITPGDSAIPGPKVDFAREFGKAAVKAIDDVLAKGPQPVVRMNAIRMLGVIAESGAPAATERITKLLADKDKALAVESLYYGLKAAEQAIAMYDPARSALAQKWVNKDMFFELVALVDDVVQKVPASVAEKTYQPDQPNQPNTGVLATDPKSPPKPAAPTQLTPEQVATVQAFRLQAIRALGRVKTDVVLDGKAANKRRTAYTLARVAVSDTTLVPAPNFKEIAEAVNGLANVAPVDPDIDPLVLAVAMARGVSDFVSDKAAGGGGGDSGPQATHWRLTGARMKATFLAWDTVVNKSRLEPAGKGVLREFSQLAVTQVFDPLSKQNDNGVVSGLKKEAVDEWLSKKMGDVKAMQLYKDTDKSKDSGTSKLSPR